jgi:hypothetical protein
VSGANGSVEQDVLPSLRQIVARFQHSFFELNHEVLGDVESQGKFRGTQT